ncbi:hypothetical protein X975_13030, partial [Stegodyphus mimosarum]
MKKVECKFNTRKIFKNLYTKHLVYMKISLCKTACIINFWVTFFKLF